MFIRSNDHSNIGTAKGELRQSILRAKWQGWIESVLRALRRWYVWEAWEYRGQGSRKGSFRKWDFSWALWTGNMRQWVNHLANQAGDMSSQDGQGGAWWDGEVRGQLAGGTTSLSPGLSVCLQQHLVSLSSLQPPGLTRSHSQDTGYWHGSTSVAAPPRAVPGRWDRLPASEQEYLISSLCSCSAGPWASKSLPLGLSPSALLE